MSTEYALRMDALRIKREELTARRIVLEKQIALREATAAEFSAVAQQSYAAKWKRARAAAVHAKTINDTFIESLHAMQQRAHEALVRHRSDLTASAALLEREKARYAQKLETVYPAWQERQQAARLQTLQALEDKKRSVEKRRHLAKKTFEKERSLDDLIRQTSHEIELAERLEQNEVYERELLRRQSAVQSARLDHSIREHAHGARSFLQQQSDEHLRDANEIDDHVADTLLETFSPRRALDALQQANRSLSFENAHNDPPSLPERSIRLEIPRAAYRPSERHANEQQQLPRSTAQAQQAQSHNVARVGSEPPMHQHSGVSVVATTEEEAPIIATHVHLQPASRLQEPPVSATTTSDAALEQQRRDNGQANTAVVSVAIVDCNDLLTSAASWQHPMHPVQLHAPIDLPTQRVAVATSVEPATAVLAPVVATDLHARDAATHASAPAITVEATAARNDFVEQLVASHTIPAAHDAAFDLAAVVAPTSLLVSSDNVVSQARALSSTRQSTDTVAKSLLSSDAASAHSDSEASVDDASSRLNAELAVDPFDTHANTEPQPSEAGTNSGFSPVVSVVRSFRARSDSVGASDDLLVTSFSAVLPLSSSSDRTQHSKVDLTFDFAASLDASPASLQAATINSVERSPSPLVEPRIASIRTIEVAAITCDDTVTSAVSSALQGQQPTVLRSDNDDDSDIGIVKVKVNADEDMHNAPMPLKRAVSRDRMPRANDVDNNNQPTQANEWEFEIADAATAAAKPTPVEEKKNVSPLERLSMAEKAKALAVLIARVEAGATDGDAFSAPSTAADNGSNDSATADAKRELVRMAIGDRKAQINFFGSDICFELVLDIARAVGPALFPTRAFEGIMSDQKLRKMHQNSKNKELELWKLLSTHMKELATLRALPVAEIAEVFGAAFLDHDNKNQRSMRKMSELLYSVCGAKAAPSVSPKKDSALGASPSTSASRNFAQLQQLSQRSGGSNRSTIGTRNDDDDDEFDADDAFASARAGAAGSNSNVASHSPSSSSPAPRFETPTLLQTALLQHQSPPKPKAFGLATSGYKKKSDAQDVLQSMASSPAKLSHKLLRGGKMNDYSEFEEDEVDLQSLIGSRGMSATAMRSTGASAASGLGPTAATTGTSFKTSTRTVTSRAAAARDDADFDVDF